MLKLKSYARKLYTVPEYFFLVGTFLFGSIFVLLTPPLQTPDETSHFLRAYQVSQFGILATNQNGVMGSDLPISVSETIGVVGTNPEVQFHPETKYNLHKTVEALKMDLQRDKTSFANIGGAVNYSPVGYIPQSTGIMIGSMLGLPPVALMYIARFAILAAWAGLLFGSIRLIPYRKWTLAGLALLPMLVAQAGSPGIDALSIGLSILFISYILHLRNIARPIAMKSFLLIVLLGGLIGLMKETSVIVLGFVFLLKLPLFDKVRWKAVMKISLVVLLPLLLLVGWNMLVSSANLDSGSSGIIGQDAAGQVMNLIHHPLRLLQVIFNTFFFNWGDGVVNSFIGVFGWMDTPLAGGLISLGYVLITFMLFVNYESFKGRLSRVSKLLIAGLAAVYVIGTCAALYVIYSPVDFNIVYGLQGRYFLLSLFILLPLLSAVPIRMSKPHYVATVCAASTFLLAASALTIYFRYYITYF